MPMPLPPQGGLPSPMTQAPPNAGSMAMPQGNQGNVQAAMTMVKNAAEMLGKALTLIPMGSEQYTKVAKIVSDLSKGIGEVSENPKLQMAQMAAQMKQKAQGAPIEAMMRQFSASQGAGQPPATEAA